MQDQNQQVERPSRTRRAFQVFFLFALLVVAPLGSWLYLRSGLDYRKEHLASLEEGVPIPDLSWETWKGDALDSGDWLEQINLILFAEDSVDLHHQAEAMSLVHSQFDDREDVIFYQVIQDSLLGDTSMVGDTSQWRMISPINESARSFREFCIQTFPSDPKHSVYLVDRRGVLRQSFSIEDHSSLTRLVEVVAILLPPKKLSHPELNRTKEK